MKSNFTQMTSGEIWRDFYLAEQPQPPAVDITIKGSMDAEGWHEATEKIFAYIDEMIRKNILPVNCRCELLPLNPNQETDDGV